MQKNKKEIAFFASILAFVLLLGFNFLKSIDIIISNKIRVLWSPLLNKFMILITSISNLKTMLVLSALLLIILIYRKKEKQALITLFALLITAMAGELLKLIFHRTRPIPSLISAIGYSFPSIHSAISCLFFLLLIYYFKDDIKNLVLKKLFIFSSVLLFLLIGFSRIYLNVHWFSDVIAGFCMGAFMFYLLICLEPEKVKLSGPQKAKLFAEKEKI